MSVNVARLGLPPPLGRLLLLLLLLLPLVGRLDEEEEEDEPDGLFDDEPDGRDGRLLLPEEESKSEPKIEL